MCITKIEAFRDSKGGIHPLEKSALVAEVIIITGYNAASTNAMFDNAEKLIPLLQRHVDMQAEKAMGEKASTEPTTLSASTDPTRRSALLGRLQKWAQADLSKNKDKARQFIVAGGYADLTDLNNRATDADVEAMHEELGELGVE